METFKEVIKSIIEFFEEFGYFFTTKLFSLGQSDITLVTIGYLLVSVIGLVYVSNKLSKFIGRSVLRRYSASESTVHTISTIIKYVILVIGLMVIVQSAGIDLSTLSILAGALGVGIGFGLQNITNNFISGVIILFEQPIKVGDRIEVANIKGDVTKISARATTVLTNDNISVIVPNSEFISSTVINWSHNDRNVSFRFPVGVSYKEDPKKIKQLLLEVAKENPGVLNTPEPDVLFDEFGDSSLNFFLRVWTTDYTSRPNILKSQLYYSIFEKFHENGVEIPFPQQDLHLKSGFENLKN
ncbi:mechanosensitive ion channel family protein [Fulvivirga lutea]|uniref:Mechanosensitive ion channel family protein n=1 Tax=Fulvivirga lutea TaxID=2810512 RepID=A0A974ZZY8_9BACT|nr:mechanosensitive ion channel domain-containing protein [Fulvivirga lutea]QSE96266.1 mechanosensitive ion channel family protein [Fulvivirga lutea]